MEPASLQPLYLLTGAVLLLLVVGGAGAFVYLRRSRRLLDHRLQVLQQQVAETRALLALQEPNFSQPLPWTAWTISAECLMAIVESFAKRQITTVVECGAGISTLYLARLLRDTGGKLYTLEHDAAWAESIGAALEREGLAEQVEILVRPLRRQQFLGREAVWYSLGAPEALGFGPVDLLLVDAPPSSAGPLARLGAVPLLWEALAPEAEIFLDDATRPEEQEILELWCRELPLTWKQQGGLRPYARLLRREA